MLFSVTVNDEINKTNINEDDSNSLEKSSETLCFCLIATGADKEGKLKSCRVGSKKQLSPFYLHIKLTNLCRRYDIIGVYNLSCRYFVVSALLN